MSLVLVVLMVVCVFLCSNSFDLIIWLFTSCVYLSVVNLLNWSFPLGTFSKAEVKIDTV